VKLKIKWWVQNEGKQKWVERKEEVMGAREKTEWDGNDCLIQPPQYMNPKRAPVTAFKSITQLLHYNIHRKYYNDTKTWHCEKKLTAFCSTWVSSTQRTMNMSNRFWASHFVYNSWQHHRPYLHIFCIVNQNISAGGVWMRQWNQRCQLPNTVLQ